MYHCIVLVQPGWIVPRIYGQVSTGGAEGPCNGVCRSQFLTCRFGCTRVGEAPVGLSTVSSWKFQAHSWFRLILPSRLRWSLPYSALKRKRRQGIRICSQLRSKKKSSNIQEGYQFGTGKISEEPTAFLSVEVSAFGGVPLWSYLHQLQPFSLTPSHPPSFVQSSLCKCAGNTNMNKTQFLPSSSLWSVRGQNINNWVPYTIVSAVWR